MRVWGLFFSSLIASGSRMIHTLTVYIKKTKKEMRLDPRCHSPVLDISENIMVENLGILSSG